MADGDSTGIQLNAFDPGAALANSHLLYASQGNREVSVTASQVLDYVAASGLSGFIPTVGAPLNTVGRNGQVALDATNGIVYGPKANGVWTSGISLASSAPNVSYTAGLPGAVDRSAQAKLDEFANINDFGADPSGALDSSQALILAANSGAPGVLIPRGTFRLITATISGLTNVVIYGEAGSVFKPDYTYNNQVINFLNCNGVHISGVKFVGDLVSRTQYNVAYSGIQAYFTTPTFLDQNQNVLSTADFTWSFSNTTLSTNLGSLTGQTARWVVSNLMPVDPSQKYVVDIADYFRTGQGATSLVWRLYDNTGTFMRVYDPRISTDPNALSYFTGASYIAIALGSGRFADTVSNATVNYDVSKVKILKLIDKAALTDSTNSPNYQSYLYFNNCTDIDVEHNEFDLARAICITGVPNNKRIRIRNNKCGAVWQFIESFGVNQSIKDNFGDQRLLADDGLLYDQLFIRRHAVSAGGACSDLSITHNEFIGASWGIEVILPGLPWRCLYNKVSAAMCGISAGNGQDIDVSHNDIRVGSLANYGIEVTGAITGGMNTVKNNRIRWKQLIDLGFGMTIGAIDLLVADNDIYAPIGMVDLSGSNSGRTIHGGTIRFDQLGIDYRGSDITISDMAIKVKNSAYYSTSQANACVSLSTQDANQIVLERLTLSAPSTYSMQFTAKQQIIAKNITITHPYLNKTSVNASYTSGNAAAIGNANWSMSNLEFTGMDPSVTSWMNGTLNGTLSSTNNLLNGKRCDFVTPTGVTMARWEGRVGSVSWTPGTLSALGAGVNYASVVVFVSSLAFGDTPIGQLSVALPAGVFQTQAEIVANNQIRISVINMTASSVTLAAMTASVYLTRA